MVKNSCSNCGLKTRTDEPVSKCERCGGECFVDEGFWADIAPILVILYVFGMFAAMLAGVPGGVNNPLPPHIAHRP